MMKLLLSAVALAAATAAAAATASTLPGFAGCSAFTSAHPKLAVRPTQIVTACGDGNFYLSKLHWVGWSYSHAVANGTANSNDCTPNCAAGKFHTYPVTVTLSAVATCHGRHEFTKIAWTYTHTRPAHAKATESMTFPCK